MQKQNQQLLWLFLLLVLGGVATTAIGFITNILTADPNPQKLFTSGNRTLWLILGALILLVAVIALVTPDPSSKESNINSDKSEGHNPVGSRNSEEQNFIQNLDLRNWFIQINQVYSGSNYYQMKKLVFYCLSLILIMSGVATAWLLQSEGKILGIFLSGISVYLYLTGRSLEESSSGPQNGNSPISMTWKDNTVINELNQNINYYHDISQIESDICRIWNAYSKLDLSLERLNNIKSEIINEIRKESRSNTSFRDELYRSAKQTGRALTELEIIQDLVEKAIGESNQFDFYQNSEEVREKYQKLKLLLHQKKWIKADEETASLILKLCGMAVEPEIRYEEWLDFPRMLSIRLRTEDLNSIDTLWRTYSNGKFGFSVQKKLWKELLRKYKEREEDRYFCFGGIDEEAEFLEEFGRKVGWYVDDDWIYLSDIGYSSSIPPGHLPAQVLFDADHFETYHQFQPNYEVLKVFMGRQYK